MTNRKPRVATAAESWFETLCNDAGVVPQRVHSDESGWDFLVEVETNNYSGPAEDRPPPQSFYVQVKSTTGKAPTVSDLTLNNAQKMCANTAPWFLVLVHSHKGGIRTVYAKHIWKDFIDTALKEVRKSDLSNRKLNKSKLRIKFGPSDNHGQDRKVVEWMEETVREIGDDYSKQKRDLNRLSGFEDGGGVGRFTIDALRAEDIHLGFLGLKGLPVKDFEFTPARFGLADNKRMLQMAGGTLSIKPDATAIGVLRLRQLNTANTLAIVGNVISSPPIMGTPGWSRVVAGVCDIVIRSDGSCQFRVSMDSGRTHSMHDFAQFATVRDWTNSGKVLLEFESDGERTKLGTIGHQENDGFSWSSLSAATKRWVDLNKGGEKFCLSELVKSSPSLVAFERCLTSHDMGFQTDGLEPDLSQAESIVYTCIANCGNRRMVALVERAVVTHTILGNRQQIAFGRPNVIDIRTGNIPNDGMMDSDEKSLSELVDGRKGKTIGIPDVCRCVIDPDASFTFIYGD